MNDKEFDEFLEKHRLIDAMRKEIRSAHHKKTERRHYTIKDLDDIIDDKIESMERYYVKQVSNMVAAHKILAPKTYVKDNTHLQDLIIDFMMKYNDGVLLRRLNPYKGFIDEVIEYINIHAGYLHIKEFISVRKEEKQKSLDDLFWT